MTEKHGISTYHQLNEAINHFLNESFSSLEKAMQEENLSFYISENINKVNTNKEDLTISENYSTKIPESPIQFFQSNLDKMMIDEKILSSETINSLSEAYAKGVETSKKNTNKFPQNHTIESTLIISHINNFGFFIETLTNRHLLFLKHSKLIDEFSYKRIEKARILERLIYIFKDRLTLNKLHLNELSNLFTLRNKTVHYTPDNSISLKPKISELIQIWNQSLKIILEFEKKQEFRDDSFSSTLKSLIVGFKNKWI